LWTSSQGQLFKLVLTLFFLSLELDRESEIVFPHRSYLGLLEWPKAQWSLLRTEFINIQQDVLFKRTLESRRIGQLSSCSWKILRCIFMATTLWKVQQISISRKEVAGLSLRVGVSK
jgi:hypothetical protein